MWKISSIILLAVTLNFWSTSASANSIFQCESNSLIMEMTGTSETNLVVALYLYSNNARLADVLIPVKSLNNGGRNFGQSGVARVTSGSNIRITNFKFDILGNDGTITMQIDGKNFRYVPGCWGHYIF